MDESRYVVIDTRATRVLAILLLIAGQWGLGIWFATSDRESTVDRLTEAEQVDATNDLNGRSVIVTGTVVGTDPVAISLSGSGKTGDLIIRGLETPVSVGTHVQASGRLVGPRTFVVREAIVVPKWGLWYAWTISFLAGVWVLIRVGRQWQGSLDTLSIKPREETVTGRDRERG